MTCILTVGAFKALRFNCFCFQAVSIKNSIQKQPRFLMAFFFQLYLRRKKVKDTKIDFFFFFFIANRKRPNTPLKYIEMMELYEKL